MTRDYQVPLTEIRKEHSVSNSRFIATLGPIASADDARAFIDRIKKEFADATHNVPAYILGGGNTVIEFSSDDGEPSGTAGRPALTVLRGSGLGDVALVITRYFGGTLLGTGGLVKAYTESAQLVANAVGRGVRQEVGIALLAFPYNYLERIRLLIVKYGGSVVKEDFGGDVIMTLQLPLTQIEAFQISLRELSAGKLQAELIETREEIVPVDSK